MSQGRRTKIVATIGPASESPAVLRALVDAGMDVARLSLAHGPVEAAIERLHRVRAAADDAGRVVGVLADLPGAKVRAAPFAASGVELAEGARVALVPADGAAGSDGSRIAVRYPTLLEDLRAGDVVGLGDGGVMLLVEEVGDAAATAVVRGGGVLRGRPGVNLPPERVALVSPTEDDLRFADAMASAGADALALSFVRSAGDVLALRRSLAPDGPMVVAKIETPSAVDDLEAVLAASDGVMVARGDLGVRVPLEDVPHIQKRIIRTGVSWAKPVITATQMLESMVSAPTPTRAEVTDVANAVIDGTSALMLSGETAVGHDPALVVRTMARIAARAEAEFDYWGWGRSLGQQQTAVAAADGASPNVRIVAAITAAAWRAANDADAAAIICCTRTGLTARAISRFRPTAPLLAVTPSTRTARQLAMAWGVRSVTTEWHESTDDLVWFAVQAAVELGLAAPGQVVVVLAGSPVEAEPTTDVLRLVRVR